MRELTVDEVIEEIGFGWVQYRVVIICGLAFMADAIEVLLISFMSICVTEEWDLNESLASSIASVVFGGEILGSFFWGPVSDLYGRRKVFIASVTLIIIAGVLSGFSFNISFLLITRFIVGFGIGGLFVPFDILAELLPMEKRGRYLLLLEIFWTVGSCLLCSFAWISLNSLGWRGLIFAAVVPMVISLLSSYYLPESPRWLVSKGQTTQAKQVLDSFAEANKANIGNYTIPISESHAIQEGSIIELLKPPYLKITIPLWVLWTAFGFAYYGVILFITRVFQKGDNDDDDNDDKQCSFDYQDIFISACAEYLGILFVILVVDRWGRRWTQGVSYFFSAVGCVALGLPLSNQALTGFSFLARGFAMGATSVTWVATPELYPTQIRATGHSAANGVARIGAFISPYLVSSESLSLLTAGIVLAVVNILAMGCSLVLPETSHKPLDQAAFSSSHTRFDDNLKLMNLKSSSTNSGEKYVKVNEMKTFIR